VWTPFSNPKFWPTWAPSTTTAVWSQNRYWLVRENNEGSTLWTVRDLTGKVLANQLDLPFKDELPGAPTTWADEVLNKKQVA
jgi:hypothetical protein